MLGNNLSVENAIDDNVCVATNLEFFCVSTSLLDKKLHRAGMSSGWRSESFNSKQLGSAQAPGIASEGFCMTV